MKRTLLLLLLLTACCRWAAVAYGQTLVLHHADGTETEVQLYVMPKMTFDGNQLCIESPVVHLQYKLGEVVSYSFKDNTDGMEKLADDPAYEQRHGNLIFHGITSAADVAVFDSRGMQLPVRVTVNGSQAVLPLSALPSGVSMIRVNGRTAKFIRP